MRSSKRTMYANISVPKDIWIYRKENNYWLAMNPGKNEMKKLTELPKKLKREAVIIENKTIDNSLSAPIKIFVDITKRCNLRCLHCLSSSGTSNNDLPFKTIKEIFTWAKKRGVFQIKLGGGEPILHPQFWQIINLANNSHLVVSLSTNGCLINRTIAKRFKNLGIKVSVSLDGNEKRHDALRGRGVFTKALNSLDLLVKQGVSTSIGTTITNSKSFNNLEDIPFLVSLAKEYNIRIKIRRAKPCGRATENLLALTTPNQEYWETIKWLNSQKKKGIKIDLEDIANFDENVDKKMFQTEFDCGAGTRGFHVNSLGEVSPCVFLGEEFNAGKINNAEELDNIWNNSEKFFLLRELTKNANDKCKNCQRKSRCGGECRAIAYATTGHLNAVDPCCPLLCPDSQYNNKL